MPLLPRAARRCLAALCLLATALILPACGNAGPGDAISDATYAIEDGDYDKAIQIMPPSIRGMFGDDKLKQMLREARQDIEEKGGIESVKVTNEVITGNTATLTVTTVFGNGTSEVDDMKMELMDDQWVLADDEMEDK